MACESQQFVFAFQPNQITSSDCPQKMPPEGRRLLLLQRSRGALLWTTAHNILMYLGTKVHKGKNITWILYFQFGSLCNQKSPKSPVICVEFLFMYLGTKVRVNSNSVMRCKVVPKFSPKIQPQNSICMDIPPNVRINRYVWD